MPNLNDSSAVVVLSRFCLKSYIVVFAATKLNVLFGLIHDLYRVALKSFVTEVYVNSAPCILFCSVFACVIEVTTFTCLPFELSLLSITTISPDAIREPAFLLASEPPSPPSTAFETELAKDMEPAPSASSSSVASSVPSAELPLPDVLSLPPLDWDEPEPLDEPELDPDALF